MAKVGSTRLNPGRSPQATADGDGGNTVSNINKLEICWSEFVYFIADVFISIVTFK
jgi:hypothetical protein